MGRKKNNKENRDVKKKLKESDTKYRNRMQFLYDILKTEFPEVKPTRESLLEALGESIVNKEQEFVKENGLEELNNIKEEFSKLFSLEEQIWKTAESPSDWWKEVQKMLEDFVNEDTNADCVKYSMDYILYQKDLNSPSTSEEHPRKRRRRSNKKKMPKVDEACFADDVVPKVDEACFADDVVPKVDEACFADDFVPKVDEACFADDFVPKVEENCFDSGFVRLIDEDWFDDFKMINDDGCDEFLSKVDEEGIADDSLAKLAEELVADLI